MDSEYANKVGITAAIINSAIVIALFNIEKKYLRLILIIFCPVEKFETHAPVTINYYHCQLAYGALNPTTGSCFASSSRNSTKRV